MPPEVPLDRTSPSGLELLRSATDEAVLRLLMTSGRLTRAEIAARSGISKPTVSKSMRRLEELALVADTGARTTGVGRSGNYYAIDPGAGIAMIGVITPGQVALQLVDALGATHQTISRSLPHDPGEGVVREVLVDLARTLAGQAVGPIRRTFLSAADPVDRETGALVQLPDAPFLVGALDARRALRGIIDEPILVDNDVNWSARAERTYGAAQGVDNFVMLHLGKGLGMATALDGKVRVGGSGLAGEPSHLVTTGPGGQAMLFTEVFSALGLRRPPSTEIDLQALAAHLATSHGLATIAAAVHGVISAAIAVCDPEVVVLGGEWGVNPTLLAAVQERMKGAPRSVALRSATVATADLVGTKIAAVEELRTALVAVTR